MDEELHSPVATKGQVGQEGHLQVVHLAGIAQLGIVDVVLIPSALGIVELHLQATDHLEELFGDVAGRQSTVDATQLGLLYGRGQAHRGHVHTAVDTHGQVVALIAYLGQGGRGTGQQKERGQQQQATAYGVLAGRNGMCDGLDGVRHGVRELIKVKLEQLVVAGEVYEEHLAVDEAAPVVDARKLKARLDGHQFQLVHLLLEAVAIAGHPLEEEEAGIKAQHAILGVAVVHLLGIPAAVGRGEADGGRQQVVGVERRVEVGVQLEEGIQVVLGVGLPLGIAKEVDALFGVLAHGQHQLGQDLDEGEVAARGGYEEVLFRGAEALLQLLRGGFVAHAAGGNAPGGQLLFQSLDEFSLLFAPLLRFDKDNLLLGKLPHEVVIHLGVEVGLGGVDLIDHGVGEDGVVLRGEGDNEPDIVLLAILGQGGDVLLMAWAEDDVHLLQLLTVEQRLDGALFIARVVGVEVDVHPRALQAIYSHEESFVVLRHARTFGLRHIQEGEDHGGFDYLIPFGGLGRFVEELLVGGHFGGSCRFGRCGVGDAEQAALLQLVASPEFGIGCDELFLADAILPTDAEQCFFLLHPVHLAATGCYALLLTLWCDGRLGCGRGYTTPCSSCYCTPCGRGGLTGRDADDLSDAEVLCTQSGIGCTDLLGCNAILHRQPVERLAGSNGVEALFARCLTPFARYAEGTSRDNLLVTAWVELYNLLHRHPVHAGDGVEALTLLDGVEKAVVRLLGPALSQGEQAQQQQASYAVDTFHVVLVVK